MCGRLAHDLLPEDYQLYFGLDLPPMPPNWDVRPTDALPIVRRLGRRLEAVNARWGFAGYKQPLFNARSESVAEKPAFAGAFRSRRALLMVRGWYEWKPQNGSKQRYLISRIDHKPVVMAALWEGERFTVLTTEANTEMAEYHHRKPVVLLQRDWAGWLDQGTALEQALAMLKPFPHPVFSVVNSSVGAKPK